MSTPIEKRQRYADEVYNMVVDLLHAQFLDDHGLPHQSIEGLRRDVQCGLRHLVDVEYLADEECVPLEAMGSDFKRTSLFPDSEDAARED